MWQLIKAEYFYHRKLFGGFLIAIPFLWLLIMYLSIPDLPLGMLLFVMLFLMLQSWTSARSKEKRDRLQALLPLTRSQIALARVSLVFILTLIYAGLNSLFVNQLISANYFDIPFILKTSVIIIIGFSVYFIARDMATGLSAKFRIAKNSIMIGGILVLLGLNFFGLFTMQLLKTTGESPVNFKPFIYLIVYSDPFPGEYGLLKFLAWVIVFGSLTLLTFNRRKSFTD